MFLPACYDGSPLYARAFEFWHNHLQVKATVEVIYDLVVPIGNLIFGAVIDPSLSGQVS